MATAHIDTPAFIFQILPDILINRDILLMKPSQGILKYKLEAMRIRGYDIDIQELERYDRVFLDAK